MEIRPARPTDVPEVLRLLSCSLGWLPDADHAAFFAWKHERNPFGPSLAWVAVEGGRIVGLRAFLRWEFECDGEVARAVRAVDTATHPDHRARGVFSRLTRHSLAELPAAGVAFVFNTPNDQSRPGYLKMGWQALGRLPTQARPRSPVGLARMARARTPAELWSTPTAAARPAGQVLTDRAALDELLSSQPSARALRTRRTATYLAWRYAGLALLDYRAHVGAGGPADGVVLFRLRRRGPALEAAIGDVLVPGGHRRRAAELAREVLRLCGADYAVTSGAYRRPWPGFVPVPGHGPVLTWRGLGDNTGGPVPAFDLSLGDVELF